MKQAPRKTTKKKAAKKTRFAGLKGGGDRTPLLAAGEYEVTVLSNEEGTGEGGNESWIAKVRVDRVLKTADDSDRKGDERALLFLTSGRAQHMGQQRLKNYMIASMGYTDEADYDEFDPDGFNFCASLGEEAVDDDGNEYPGNVGASLRVRVRRGKEVLKDGKPTGDYFRELSFEVVDEDEDDAAESAAADDDE